MADLYFPLLGAASAVWLLAAAVRLVHVAPWLGRAIPVVELERDHEESKLRVIDAHQG